MNKSASDSREVDQSQSLQWKQCRDVQLWGVLSDVDFDTGACRFYFDADSIHTAVITDPRLKQANSPYLQAARLELPMMIVADYLEAWIEGEPLYDELKVVGTPVDPWAWPHGPTMFDDAKAIAQEIYATGVSHPAYRAEQWARSAPIEEIWDVLQQGGLGAKMGLAPSIAADVGRLACGGTFREGLSEWWWAKEAGGDLGMWLLSSKSAQKGARNTLRWSILNSLNEFVGIAARLARA